MTLIHFYAKCGNIENALDVFKKMPRKDATTWTAMILGLAVNGNNDMALDLFKEMERRGPNPIAITFCGLYILSLC